MLPQEVHQLFTEIIQAHRGELVPIKNQRPLGGGSINHALKIETHAGDYFLKWNSAQKYPGMFESEARGLNLLHQAAEIYTPQVLGSRSGNEYSLLVL